MEKLKMDVDEGAPLVNAIEARLQEEKKLSIQRCIQALIHACQCKDASCPIANCCKMKRVVTHTKFCKRKSSGGCPICKQLLALCCYHAKHCHETTDKCSVPFCSNIKSKLMHQRFQRIKLDQLRRRMALMTLQPNASTSVKSEQSNT